MPAVDYEFKAKQIEQRLFNDEKIAQINKKYVKEFLENYHVSPARRGIVFSTLQKFLRETKDIKKDMLDDKAMNVILNKVHREKPGYFETFRNVVPMFCKRLNDDEPVKPLLKSFKKFPKVKNARDIGRKDMLTWDDGVSMIKATNDVQMKAIIAVQLDAGCRPSEFIDLNYGDVERKNDFIALKVKGKTGKRDVVCWRCVPHLLRWMQAHPTKEDNAPLWVNVKGERYVYKAIVKRLNIISMKAFGGKRIRVEKAGGAKVFTTDVPKRHIDMYLLRHSSCFIDKLDNVPMDVAAERHGHSIEFFKDVYGRLDVSDTIERIRRHNGFEGQEREKAEQNVVCSRCDFVNEPSKQFCGKCGAPLTVKKAMEIERKKSSEVQALKERMAKLEGARKGTDNIMDKLVKDPDVQKVLMKKMIQLGLGKVEG